MITMDMRVVTVNEKDFGRASEFQAFIARELGFPPYYGGNLAALADCLTDVDRPTLVCLNRNMDLDGDELATWFDGVCMVFQRCSRENPNLDVIIEFLHDREGAETPMVPGDLA